MDYLKNTFVWVRAVSRVGEHKKGISLCQSTALSLGKEKAQIY